MVTIDLAATSVREANERIRKHGAEGTDVEIINPDARRAGATRTSTAA